MQDIGSMSSVHFACDPRSYACADPLTFVASASPPTVPILETIIAPFAKTLVKIPPTLATRKHVLVDQTSPSSAPSPLLSPSSHAGNNEKKWSSDRP